MIDPIDQLLHDHGLRKTAFREKLLSLFIDSKSSLSVDDVRKEVGKAADKVTVYRALDSFESNGLIHKVPDKGNLTRYAACRDDCSTKKHIHNHAHFICNQCGVTYCIEDFEIPTIQSIGGFHIDKASITLEGECEQCINKNQN